MMAGAIKDAMARTRLFGPEHVRVAASLAEACELLSQSSECDLAVLDLHLEDAQGRDTVQRFRETFPDVPILVFTADSSIANITMAFECGARGFLPKSASAAVVRNAIELVLSGHAYIPEEAAQILGLPRLAPRESIRHDKVALELSPRQQQVFRLLLQGLPNKVIAARLNMAEGTAKTHLFAVYRLLGVRTRVEAILRASQLGLV